MPARGGNSRQRVYCACMETDKQLVHARLDPEDKAKLRAQARNNKRSMIAEVSFVLEQYLAQKDLEETR